MNFQELFECKRSGGFDSRFTLAGSQPQYSPDQPFDTEHLRLDLDLDIAGRALRGVCSATLRALSAEAPTMTFDAVSFKIDSVKADGRPVKYAYDGRKLTVTFARPVKAGARVRVDVAYRVRRPKLGLYFVGGDRRYPDKPVQVWTQGEDEYARYWFPCHDSPQDRVTTEMIVRVPRGFTAISNGRLRLRKPEGRKVRFHWVQDIPHATYLVTLAVGKFSEVRDRWRRVPVLYYCPPGREEDAKRAFGKTPKMMEFFSKMIGVPYAYPKYAQVAAIDFIYGGMENTSATTQTELTLHDERAHIDFSSDPLVAHELAHQWFGDLLTCKSWPHAWLNESFATYFEALFQEHDKGKDEFHLELRQNAEAYFEEDKEHYRRPIVTKVYKLPSDLFDRHLYEKGSLVLHMLRAQLGDDGFWKSIHAYVADNREKVVETGDLLKAIQKATGRNLERFFDQWVYKAGHPDYRVRAWWDPKAKQACVRVVQAQHVGEETGLFSMPIIFELWVAGKPRRFVETVDKKAHLFKFKLPSAPEQVLFDPDHDVLKRMDFPKPEAALVRQLEHPHILNRIDAARALGQGCGPAGFAALSKALFKEKFWAVQGEIARALGNLRTPEAVQALLKAFRSLEHPKARRMLMTALGTAKSAEANALLRSSYHRERSYFAEAQAIKALAQSGDPALPKVLNEALKRPSWNDVIRSGAVEAWATLRSDDAFAVLRRHTEWGHSQPLRMAAVRSLAQLGPREDVQKLLIALLGDKFLLVQLAAMRALMQVGDERAVPALKKFTEGDLDGRLKRMAEEAILKLKKGIEEDPKKK